MQAMLVLKYLTPGMESSLTTQIKLELYFNPWIPNKTSAKTNFFYKTK